MNKNLTIAFALIVLLSTFLPFTAKANFGANGIHDPSSIIKLNGVYHVWGTGNQISHLTSTDLVNWTVAPTVFAPGTWPSWINTYVTNFSGNFWAPECIFMNGKYYLYYSCSMGQRPCAIGVATSTDLVNWTDEGMVIYSDNSSTYGSIDPAVFADAANNYWMVFGSHLTGIWIAQINPSTGKRLNTTLTNIAGSSNSEHEAAFIMYEKGYYYLFYNVGICCALTNSTYNVQMGRSASPAGPYFDKNGVSLLSGGGTTSLSTSGRYIGPGHYGLFKENGRTILTMHYYDGTSNGYPRLDLATLKFGNDGWPVVTRDLLPNGRYTVSNKTSGLRWEAAGCTGAAGQQLIQNTPDDAALCQQWDLTSVGDGFYRLKSAKTVAAEQVVDVPFCNTANGTLLGTWDWLDNDCQKFKIDQLASGGYVFSPAGNADKVIEVPFASTAPGTQLALFDYNQSAGQQWSVNQVNSISAPLATPAENITTNSFTAKWDPVPEATGYKLDVSPNSNFSTAAATTLAAWNFTTGNTSSTSTTANSGKTVLAVGTTAATYTTTAQATGWNDGAGTKYWEAANISTAGYYSIKLSSRQRSSATGPKHFKLQYKIGLSGVYTDVPGAYITNADNYTNGVLNNVALPSECDNQASLYLRWLSTSNKSVNNATVDALGQSNIDDITISGFNTPGNSFVTGYNNLDVTGTSASVSGLSASGGYFYRVRAVKGSITSSNSNIVGVSTAGAVDNGIHDPSSIVKEGSTYWMYGTGYGNGDGSTVPFTISYSTDLFKWTRGTKPVFATGTWPAWITTAVPNFAGIFWAPEIIFLNGKYYLFYSASAFGSSTSVIGLATSPTLDQNSPNYGWTDQGMVVSSSSSTNVNAIDPAVFRDDDGRLWLSYGSFSAGLGVIELDPTTGLKKAAAATTVVAGGNGSAWEAPFILKENGFYYLFANRQFCCALLNSTYYMVVGRASNINGPYTDKNGISLKTTSSGTVVGTTVLETSGKFVGPGHFGLLRDNGRNIVSTHYYDATSNGYPRVDIATLKFSADGWPVISRDQIPEGRYRITNKNSSLVWEAAGCTGAGGQQLIQNTPDANALCQQWDLTPVGDGFYRLKNANGGTNTQVVDIPFCNVNNKLATWDWLNNDCQKFKIDKLANGSYVFSPYVNGGYVIEVPAASTAPNTQLGLWTFNEFSCQQWSIDSAIFAPVANNAQDITPVALKANWDVVPNASAYKLDVYTSANTSPVPASTIAGWNFEAGNNQANSGIPANTGKTLAPGGGVGTTVYNSPGNVTNGALTAMATGWNGGNLLKYWEAANISTKGYYDLKVSSRQRSNSTAPRHFKLQYKIGATGAYADVPGSYVTTADNYTSGILSNVQLPSICNNQPSVYLRWLMVTNTSVSNNTNANAGGISSAGQSNIDDIVVSGSNSPTYTFVPGYEDLTVNETSFTVTGLIPNTNYFYRVRSVVSGITSINSNTVNVKTLCAPVTGTVLTTNVTCNGSNNGTLSITTTGGSSPYTYQWTGPGNFASSNTTLDHLAAGDYKVTILQSNGCSSDTTYTITEPPALVASAAAGSILCNGGTTTITISASGGTAPYTGTGTFTVHAGPYTYNIVDANGCSSTVTGTISEPTTLMAAVTEGTILCNGGTTTITISASGGTAPYTGTGTSTVHAGPYTFNIVDANGCSTTVTGTISEPTSLMAAVTEGTISCNGGTTTITISASGGTAPYTGTGTFTVHAGPYTYNIVDANGCSTTVTGTISEPTTLMAAVTEGTISCNGGTTTITVSASGGTAPYTGTGTFTVHAGPYTFDIADANGCSTTVTGNISEPAPINGSSLNIAASGTTNFCMGESVTLTAPAGFAAYSWNNGASTRSVTVSQAGSYSVIVTTTNGCISSPSNPVQVTVKALPAQPTITANGPTSFYTGGSVILSAPAGFSAYSWSNGATSQSITVTTSGNYSVAVTNSNGCQSVLSDVLTVTVQTPTITLSYLDGDNGQLTNDNIRPYLQLNNEGNTAINYSTITIRYWLTVEDFSPMTNLAIDWAQVGTNNVKMKYVKLGDPRQGAYGYLEYSFDATTGTLDAYSNSGPIKSRAGKSSWTNFNETDDYSYASSGAYTKNNRITVYKNGDLVWGSEPPVIAAAQSLKVFAQDKSSGTTTNTISTYLKLNNIGNLPVNFQDITIRYWFTPDGTQPLNYYLDYAQIGNSNVRSNFVKLASPLYNADYYLELGFNAPDSLYPLSTTGNIQQRIAKNDWSNFNLLNDHSYKQGPSMAENVKITVYVKGSLVYGQEPASSTVLARNSQPAGVLPTPLDDNLNVTLVNNPVAGSNVEFIVKGAEGKILQASLIDLNGRIVSRLPDMRANAIEKLRIPARAWLSEVLFLKVSTTKEVKIIKVIKAN